MRRSHSGRESSPPTTRSVTTIGAPSSIRKVMKTFSGSGDGGIDFRVGKTAAAVEHVEPHDVAAELIFIEEPLLAEAEPANGEAAGEPAGLRGG